MKFVEELSNFRREPINHGLPFDRMQSGVAEQATAERRLQFEKIEGLENLNELLTRIARPHNRTREGAILFEKFPIFAEENSVFLTGNPDQLTCCVVISIQCIVSEHPKMMCELPKMDVEDKSRLMRHAAASLCDKVRRLESKRKGWSEIKQMKTMHAWDVSPEEAVIIQQKLRSEVQIKPLVIGDGGTRKEIQFIAGCDISYHRFSEVLYAAVVVLAMPDLVVVESRSAASKTTFPYIPGLLSFRETPAVLKAWNKLHTKPDVLLVDGHGLAHPRRFGIACHLGLWLDVPTIGCAKSLLIGTFKELSRTAGSHTELLDKGEVIGQVVRTRKDVNPIFVSVGHRVTLDDAIRIVSMCSGRYRIPEPTRQAHLLVNSLLDGARAFGTTPPLR